PYSMALRLRRICSTEALFTKRTTALKGHLVKRGYDHRFVQEQIKKVVEIPRSRALETSTKSREENRIPFVVTFNPILPNISKVIRNNISILHSSQKCREAFPSLPLISYRRSKNLRDILVRAQHRKQPPKPPGVFRCNRRRCKTCPFIKEGTSSYTFHSTNEQRQIRQHISCYSSNLIYMIQCNKCKLQYIGETKRKARNRFGEHRRAIEKVIRKQSLDQPTAVSDHFALAGHSMDNLEFIPIELINSHRDSIRKATEAFLISN
ncbi:hypothetical protein ACROYT_G000708, partial [Oculina patagonica]